MNDSARLADASRAKRLPRNVKVLGGASLLNDTASEMIFPLLPTFLLTLLGGNRFYLGLIEGAADSIASLLKLWSGGRSDQAGRRKGFVLFGYALAAFSRPGIGLIVAPWQLFLIRIGDRIGKGVRTSPRDALIADSTESSMRGRAFGFHRAMDHLGAAIGPLLAAAFLYFWPGQLRTLFLLAILPGILVVCLIALGLQETPPQPETSRKPLQLTLKPFDKNFRRYLLALAVFTLGNSSDAFLLVRAGELGVPVAILPLLWCAFHVVKSSSNLLLGPAVDRLGARPFIFVGWFVYAGVYLGFGLANLAWQAWALFLGYALFYGMTEPAEKTLVATLVADDRKGLAYGWYNFSIGIVTLPSSLIFGALYQVFGALVAFGWGALLAVVAITLMSGVVEPRTDDSDPVIA
ncbi:MAG: MFS transporter [Planctomycetaceae bacterium]